MLSRGIASVVYAGFLVCTLKLDTKYYELLVLTTIFSHVFILLQYFGTRIAHLINILENHPIMLA